jgi:hypothetical protein
VSVRPSGAKAWSAKDRSIASVSGVFAPVARSWRKRRVLSYVSLRLRPNTIDFPSGANRGLPSPNGLSEVRFFIVPVPSAAMRYTSRLGRSRYGGGVELIAIAMDLPSGEASKPGSMTVEKSLFQPGVRSVSAPLSTSTATSLSATSAGRFLSQ